MCYEMISLLELITTDKPLSKYYQFMNDKLTDLLDNIVIDITDSKPPVIRWIVFKDEYEQYNQGIGNIISQLLVNIDDIDKIN